MAHQEPVVIVAHRHLKLHCLSLLLLLGLLTACSSSDQIEQQSRTAASAAQTVSMALDAWVAGAAPFRYTADTLQSAGKTLADAEAQIRSTGTAEPAEQAALVVAVKDLSAAVARAEAGLQVGNRTELQNARQDLQAATRSLAAAYAKYFAPKP